MLLWRFYPVSSGDLFYRAFTEGIRDPAHGRVGESEWRAAMARLVDSVAACDSCDGAFSYVDPWASSRSTAGAAGRSLRPGYLELSTPTLSCC